MLFNTSVLEDHNWREGSHLAFPASRDITGSDTRASIRLPLSLPQFQTGRDPSLFPGEGVLRFISVLPSSNADCSNIMPHCSTDVLYQRWPIALVKISSEI